MADIYTTVATVVHCAGHFLLVREYDEQGILCYNQPAGHVVSGENLKQAAQRELLEETGLSLPLTAWLGVYTYQPPQQQDMFLRIAFIAQAPGLLTTQAQDPDRDVIDSAWFTLSEIQTFREHLRSPLVLDCIEDFVNGRQLDLSFIHDV